MAPVSEAEVTLFSYEFSPYAQRARLALEEKGISYKLTDVDFTNKSQALLEANPIYKAVPTIIHKGKPIAESLIILEYLEDVWPEQVPLVAKDAFEKSKVRFWSNYINETLSKLKDTIFKKSGSPEYLAAKKGIVESLKNIETAMTGYSTKGPFFTGETFGFLDVVLAPLVIFLTLTEKLGDIVVPGPGELPRLHKCLEVIQARPSYSAVFPTKEEALPHFKALAEIRQAAASK